MKVFRLTLLFYLYPLLCFTQSEEITYERYSVEDGLSHNNILSVDEDEKGNIWLATMAGINVYNGKSFKPLAFKRSSTFSNIAVDKNGFIWAIFSNSAQFEVESINIIDPETLQKINFNEYVTADPSFDILTVSGLWRDVERNIYLTTQELEVYTFHNNKLVKIHQLEPGQRIFFEGVQARTITVLSGQRKSIEFTNLETGFQENTTFPNHIIYCQHNADTLKHFISVLPNTEGRKRNLSNIAVQTIGKEIKVEADQRLINLPFKSAIGKDGVWLASRKQLFFVNADKTDHVDSIEWSNILPNGSVQTLFVDRSNTLWIGTSNGLLKRKTRPVNFEHYLFNKNINTREIIPLNRDSVLIASYSGLHLFHVKSKSFEQCISHTGYYGIDRIGKDHFLLGCHCRGIHEWHFGNKEAKLKYPFAQMKGQQALGTFSDINGKHWVSNALGVGAINEDNSSIELWNFNNGICKGWVFSYFDPHIENKIWALTSEGLAEIDLVENTYRRFELLRNIPMSFAMQDSREKDVYWIGTKKDGLLKWDRKNARLVKINTKTGLSNNTVHGVYEDRFGRLWLPTNYGINTYNKNTGEIHVYAEGDGLKVTEFNSHSSSMLLDSTLVFGSINGIVKFDPNSFSFSASSKNIQLESLNFTSRATGKKVTYSLQDGVDQTLRIPNKSIDPVLKINWVGEKLSDESKARYFISDIHKNWQYFSNDEISLGEIPYGNYYLLISYKQGINDWSPPLVYKILHAKPIYLNSWFYFVCAILGFLVLSFYQRFLRKRLLKRNKFIEDEIKLQTKNLTESNEQLGKANELNDMLFSILGHDLRSPLLSLTKTTDNLKYLAENDDTSRMLKLSKDLSNKSKHLVGLIEDIFDWSTKQRSKHKPIFGEYKACGLISEVVEQLSGDIQDKRIDVKFHSDNMPVLKTDKEILKIILRNILNNSIKYSKPGDQISIQVVNDKYPIVEIKDQCGGISREVIERIRNNEAVNSQKGTFDEKGFGFGLTICMHLINKLGGKIEFMENGEIGTLFRIHLN